MERSRQWSRLDNAAKIFPATSNKRDTKVFRYACELYEPVDPPVLKSALDRTLTHFPFYRSVLKRGLFWYYLEESRIEPEVREEARPPCAPLYDGDRRSLLFQVTYYKKRINLEVYHALSDGTGALHFIRTLVFYYLTEKHQHEINKQLFLDDYDASEDQKKLDSFYKYYSGKKLRPGGKAEKAYNVKGEKFVDYRAGTISGRFSVSAFLALARQYGATATEFVCAAMICAIHETMSVRDEKLPVVVTVPVNLRNYFPTESARNFFSIINIGHNFQTQGKTFEEVLANVKSMFKELITKENLEERMNRLSALEHSILTKIVPLVIKDPVLRYFSWLSKKEATTQFSNVGKFQLPEELRKYVRMFDVFSSTDRIQACLCSFEDIMVVSFTSSFVSTDIQRIFFRQFTGLGLEVEIASNTNEVIEDEAIEGEGADVVLQ